MIILYYNFKIVFYDMEKIFLKKTIMYLYFFIINIFLKKIINSHFNIYNILNNII